jgi:hypothetical protein
MRGITMAWAWIGILVVAGGAAHSCAAADAAVKLTGTFVWTNQAGQTHPISAVFTPSGEKKWTVVYTFDWGPKGAQNWKGTAEGDLKNGAIKGEGFHPDGRRKFTFSGNSKEGTITCTHNETTSGTPQATGTITLKKE